MSIQWTTIYRLGSINFLISKMTFFINIRNGSYIQLCLVFVGHLGFSEYYPRNIPVKFAFKWFNGICMLNNLFISFVKILHECNRTWMSPLPAKINRWFSKKIGAQRRKEKVVESEIAHCLSLKAHHIVNKSQMICLRGT